MLVIGVPAGIIALIALRDLIAALRPVKGQRLTGPPRRDTRAPLIWPPAFALP